MKRAFLVAVLLLWASPALTDEADFAGQVRRDQDMIDLARNPNILRRFLQ